jgi:O-antigen/teichoic acid export membrane protein
MKKNFSFNLLFLIALNLLIKPLYLFGIEVGIQNEVGAADYGLYYAMFNFTFLFNVLLDMGMNNFQKIKVSQDSVFGLEQMATLIPLKIILSLVYMIVTVFAALALGYEGRHWYFIGWLMLNHLLSVFLLLLRSNLSGLHLFVKDSIVSVVDRLLLVVAIGYVLWFSDAVFQIEWFVLFQFIAYMVAIVFAFVMLPAGSRWPKLNFDTSAAMNVMRQSWPYALLILLMTAYNKLDGVMIERMANNGLVEAGIYAQAYRIIDGGNNFAFLYAGMLLPIFARLVQHGDKSGISDFINQGARFLIIPAGLGCVFVGFHSEAVMQMLYDSEVATSAMAFRWLMGSFLFICVGYVFGTLLTASGELSKLNWIALLSVVSNFFLNWFLIPSLGAVGAAMASFTSLFLMAIFQGLVVYRTSESISLKWTLSALICWIFALAIAFGMSHLVQSEWIRMVGLLIGSLGVFVLVGLKKSDLKTALPNEVIDNKISSQS